MGRVALGAAKKSKTGSVRVTESQFDWFERHHGGLGRFLQDKVNEELQKAQEQK